MFVIVYMSIAKAKISVFGSYETKEAAEQDAQKAFGPGATWTIKEVEPLQ